MAKFVEYDADSSGLVSLDEAKAVLLKEPFNFTAEKVLLLLLLLLLLDLSLSCRIMVINRMHRARKYLVGPNIDVFENQRFRRQLHMDKM